MRILRDNSDISTENIKTYLNDCLKQGKIDYTILEKHFHVIVYGNSHVIFEYPVFRRISFTHKIYKIEARYVLDNWILYLV